MRKSIFRLIELFIAFVIIFSSCTGKGGNKTLFLAAASSLEHSLEEIIDIFEEENPDIKLEGVFEASGKLQTQIQEGLEVDLFFSAGAKQMDALIKDGYIEENQVNQLLENRLVLIIPSDSELGIKSFEDILLAQTIALGDPKTVPAGAYSQEVLQNMGIYNKVAEKASVGTNVTQVLNWVAEGSAEAGIVYETDAKANSGVKIVAYPPLNSLREKIIYPIGLIKESKNSEQALLFLEFLKSEQAKVIFEKYGFIVVV